MAILRLGIQIRDFDLDRVGFALLVLDRDRHDGSGGYIRMTLEELTRFVAALRVADDVDLVAIGPEREEQSPQSLDEEPLSAKSEPETSRTADVIAFPWLSKVWRGSANARPATQARPETQVAGPDAGAAADQAPKKIRITRGELRQPALF